ncbi:hypothetical protein ACFW5W_29530 [Streptomyces sp. NPDC058783]|uniref:hypothetical protein n=1 Tax=unclassified Streptomyces TaxID=2593676 RepID=UPI0036462EA0
MSRRERFLKEKMHTADGMRTIAHWSAKAGTHTELTAAGSDGGFPGGMSDRFIEHRPQGDAIVQVVRGAARTPTSGSVGWQGSTRRP